MIKFGVVLSIAAAALASAAQADTSEAMAFAIGLCSALPEAQARLKCYDDLAAKLKAGIPVAPAAAPAYAPPPAAAAAPPPAYMPPPAAAVVPPPAPVPPAAAPAQTFGQSEPAPRKDEGAWYNPGTWFGSSSESEPPRAGTQTAAEFGAESIPESKPVAGVSARPEPLDRISARVTGISFNTNGRFMVTLDNGQMWRQVDGDTTSPKFKIRGSEGVTISRGFMGSYNMVIEGHTAMFKVRRVQ